MENEQREAMGVAYETVHGLCHTMQFKGQVMGILDLPRPLVEHRQNASIDPLQSLVNNAKHSTAGTRIVVGDPIIRNKNITGVCLVLLPPHAV